MADNLGNSVSRVLEDENRAWESIIFQKLNPPLDSEFNLFQKVGYDFSANSIRKSIPSGWIRPDYIIGKQAKTASYSNVIRFKSPIAIVNGWILHIGGGTNQFQTGASNNIWTDLSNDENEIVFIIEPGPSLGTREDLVFLEVWRQLINTGDIIYKYGNTQYAGTNYTNDLIDPDVTIETSKRIALRYRIRTFVGVDFYAYKSGLGFPSISAQANNSTPTTGYPFIKSTDDPGLYIAGNGGDTAKSALGTVDGYCYSIPIARITRRNKTPFSFTNLNGNSTTLVDVASDRPDNLYYDGVEDRDIQDLRHEIKPDGWNYKSILDEVSQQLIKNQLSSFIAEDFFNLGIKGTELLQVDAISSTDRTGINDFAVPNSIQRIFSDASTDQPTIESFLPAGSDEIVLNAQAGIVNPIGTVIGSDTPTIWDIDTELTIAGTWSGLGTNEATFTPTVAGTILNKNIYTLYDLRYPKGQGLEFVIENIYKSLDQNDLILQYNNREVESRTIDLDNVRTTDSYIDSAITRNIKSFEDGSFPLNAGIAEITYYLNGNNTNEFTLPLTIYGMFINQVIRVQKMPSGDDIIDLTITKDGSGNFTVNTGLETFFTTDVLKVTLLSAGTMFDYEPYCKSIREIARTNELLISSDGLSLEYTVNVDSLYLANSGIWDRTLSQMLPSCFVDGERRRLESITGYGTPILKVKFYAGEAPTSGQEIKVPGISFYAPNSSEEIQIFYNYKPYQGVLKDLQSGNTVQGKILAVSDYVLLSTEGTNCNGYKTRSPNISDDLRSLSTRLPINITNFDYDFTGVNLNITGYSSASSSTRLVYSKDVEYDSVTKVANTLNIGDTVTIQNATDIQIYYKHNRGMQFKDPLISIRSIDLNSSIPHFATIFALIYGLGDWKGELLLMALNITSENAESKFNNSGTDNRIIGSADFYRLKNKPLILN